MSLPHPRRDALAEPIADRLAEPTRTTAPAGRAACRLRRPPWSLERALFAMAGAVTLASAALAALVTPWFLLLTAFVGLDQWLFVALGECPASLALRRLTGLKEAGR